MSGSIVTVETVKNPVCGMTTESPERVIIHRDRLSMGLSEETGADRTALATKAGTFPNPA
jgi:hypothetical protein